MQQKKPEVLKQIFYKSEKFKISQQKIIEKLRNVRSWFDKEFKASESLPPEFKDFEPQSDINKNRARDSWQKYF